MSIRDSKLAFANAISQGVFHDIPWPDTGNEYNPGWDDMEDAKNWMYMYTEDNLDYFKNTTTRQYTSVSFQT